MRLKYFVRGLGTGIIFATLVLTIAFSFKKTTLSDDEIISRAKALGMVSAEEVQASSNELEGKKEEKTVDTQEIDAGKDKDASLESENDSSANIDEELSDKKLDTENSVSKSSKADATDKKFEYKKPSDVNSASDETADNYQIQGRVPTKADEFLRNYNKNVSSKPKDKVEKFVPFTIAPGDTSKMVSERLGKSGLIDDSEKFNKYMSSLGVDNLLQAGTFYVSDQSSYDDIVAVLVTKQQFRKNTSAPTPDNNSYVNNKDSLEKKDRTN